MRAAKLAVVGLVVAALLLQGHPAGGVHDGTPANRTSDDCPHGGNYISAACLLGIVHYGVQAEWTNGYMWADTTYVQTEGAHVNHGIWTYSGSPCNAWVEVGLTYGYRGSVQYGIYFAKSDVGGNYNDFFYVSQTQSTQISNKYALVYRGQIGVGGRYGILLNDIEIDSFDNMGFGSCRSSAGLEIPFVVDDISGARIAPDSRTRSDTFNLVDLKYQRTAFSSTDWNLGWNDPGHYYVQWPCGSYIVTKCMNGLYNGLSVWSDNKPW